MLIAREATTTMVTSEVVLSAIISSFARAASGAVPVVLNAVADRGQHQDRQGVRHPAGKDPDPAGQHRQRQKHQQDREHDRPAWFEADSLLFHFAYARP